MSKPKPTPSRRDNGGKFAPKPAPIKVGGGGVSRPVPPKPPLPRTDPI